MLSWRRMFAHDCCKACNQRTMLTIRCLAHEQYSRILAMMEAEQLISAENGAEMIKQHESTAKADQADFQKIQGRILPLAESSISASLEAARTT